MCMKTTATSATVVAKIDKITAAAAAATTTATTTTTASSAIILICDHLSALIHTLTVVIIVCSVVTVTFQNLILIVRMFC